MDASFESLDPSEKAITNFPGRMVCIRSRPFGWAIRAVQSLAKPTSSISLARVSQLRKESGASIQKCKEALEHADWDIPRAIEVLRKRGESINQQRSTEAMSFRIAGNISSDGKRAVISRVASLTDFASESELFVSFCEKLNATIVESVGVSNLTSLKLQRPVSSQVRSLVVAEVLSDLSSILSEPVTISNFQVLQGDLLGVYVHGSGVYSPCVGTNASAVSVTLDTDVSSEQRMKLSDLANRIARQVLATKVKYVDAGSIPASVIEKEKELMASKIKNDAILEKAFRGHMAKFVAEKCLLDSEWIIPRNQSDPVPGMSVQQVIADECLTIGISPASFRVKQLFIQ